MTTNYSINDFNTNLIETPQMSNKYIKINSAEVVEEILKYRYEDKAIFELSSITHMKKRVSALKHPHMIKLRTIRPLKVEGDLIHPEIVIINSYDGSSAFKVEFGVFRIACSNGLIIKTKDFGSLKIRHMGTPAELATTAVHELLKNVYQIKASYDSLKTKTLTYEEQLSMAKEALNIRYRSYGEKNMKKINTKNIESLAYELIKPRRDEDKDDSIWTVMNRIQEGIVTGVSTKVENDGKNKKIRFGAINNVNHNVKINSSIFELALEYANNDSKQLLPEEVLIPTTMEEVALETVTVTETVVSSKYDNPQRITITLEDGTKKRIKNPNYIPTVKETELV